MCCIFLTLVIMAISCYLYIPRFENGFQLARQRRVWLWDGLDCESMGANIDVSVFQQSVTDWKPDCLTTQPSKSAPMHSHPRPSHIQTPAGVPAEIHFLVEEYKDNLSPKYVALLKSLSKMAAFYLFNLSVLKYSMSFYNGRSKVERLSHFHYFLPIRCNGFKLSNVLYPW